MASDPVPGPAPGPVPASAPGAASRIGFAAPHLENRECLGALTAAITRELADSEPVNGPAVRRLEDAVAAAVGRRYVMAVGSGTDALHFALAAQGIGPGDEVLVPGYSFVATASAVLRTGARPVFVDVVAPGACAGSATAAPCTIDLALAATAITPATRAMVWAGLFGGLADPATIAAFAARHDLLLVEDAAQGFGASFGGRPAGSLGHASALSFDRQKPLGAPGTGGAVATDDPDIARRVRALRYHGRAGDGYASLGFNSQLSTIAAAALLVKLPLLADWAERRRAIAARFDAALAAIGIAPLTWPDAVRHVRHKYVLVSDRRDELARHLADHGIDTKVHYPTPLHHEPVFAGLPGGAPVLPVSERMAQSALSLPIHAQLDEPEIRRIVDALLAFGIDAAASRPPVPMGPR